MNTDFYADPVIYDILNTPGTAREVDLFELIDRRFGRARSRGTWLEPACGTGRYLRTALRRGKRVSGFDSNAGCLAYAAERLDRQRRAAGRKHRAVHLAAADMSDFLAVVGEASADFALLPVNTLRHLESDEAVLSHFAQMARALKPGGVYVVGISLIDYDWLWPDEDVWEGARGMCRVRQVVNYLPPAGRGRQRRRETVISHLSIERPRRTEHRDQHYQLRTYDRRQWELLIARSELQGLASLDVKGQPRRDAVLPYQLEVLTARSS